MESSLLTKHKDRIAGKGYTSMTQYSLVRKFIPMIQAMKIPDAKAAVDKECRHDSSTSMATGKGQEQEGGYSGSIKERRRKSTLPH